MLLAATCGRGRGVREGAGMRFRLDVASYVCRDRRRFLNISEPTTLTEDLATLLVEYGAALSRRLYEYT